MSPEWFDGDRFWYRSHVGEGYEFIVVDPAAPSRRLAFDHDRLAAALSLAADTAYVATKLPFETFEFVDDGSIRFHTADSVRWSCSVTSYVCVGPDSVPADPRTEIESPDGRWVAFTRDDNLWVRGSATGEEIQLSSDGEEYFGYAQVPEGCCSAVTRRRQETESPPVLTWSADSRRIVTHRFDERNVEALHLLETRTGRPALHSYRVALPGDSVIPTYEIHVFDVEARGQAKVNLDAMDAVNTSCCGVASDTIWKDVKWADGSDEVFFTRAVRSYDTLQLYVADTETGEARKILEERSKTYVEANGRSGGPPNWRVISDNTEVVWWSERDGWGHLYLFDAATGVIKNRITEGPWMVLDLLHVDDAGRWAYFTGVGREAGQDIYYRHLYRARLDGGGVERLTPEEADHQIWMSPSGSYFVDQYGTMESEPVTVLRNTTGRALLTLETADFSKLLAMGWRYPEHFTVLARDGVTPLHGFLYFPSDFDESERYPVVDYIYPGHRWVRSAPVRLRFRRPATQPPWPSSASSSSSSMPWARPCATRRSTTPTTAT
jgi:dipeptidyl aminopeptidase/acylaminoacyl peptidase